MKESAVGYIWANIAETECFPEGSGAADKIALCAWSCLAVGKSGLLSQQSAGTQCMSFNRLQMRLISFPWYNIAVMVHHCSLYSYLVFVWRFVTALHATELI